MSEQMWWWVARASGMIAALMLVATVVLGQLQASGMLKGRVRASWLVDLHRGLAINAVGWTGVHLLALLLDSYIEFHVIHFVVPLTSPWEPWAVAPGVLAAWGLVAVQVTSVARSRFSTRTWRQVHWVSYAVVWLVIVHAVMAGTDAHHSLYRAAVAASVIAISSLGLLRLARIARRSLVDA